MREIDIELFRAVKNGDLPKIRDLLLNGANLLSERNGNTLLTVAALDQNFRVVVFIVNVLKYLYPGILDVYINRESFSGVTALNAAVYYKNYNTVRFLIENGADITYKNIHGKTAADIAKERGDDTIFDLLTSLIPLETYDSINGDLSRECPICFDLLHTKKSVITKCGHIFHEKCLKELKKYSYNCPICRRVSTFFGHKKSKKKSKKSKKSKKIIF